jgi:hypothetical protein
VPTQRALVHPCRRSPETAARLRNCAGSEHRPFTSPLGRVRTAPMRRPVPASAGTGLLGFLDCIST